MKLARTLNPMIILGLLLVAALVGCDRAPIDLTGTWTAEPLLLDSGWCRTTWTFSEDNKWKALHVFTADSLGTRILRREQSFGLWLFEPGSTQRIQQRDANVWQLAFMKTGVERKREIGIWQGEPWIPVDDKIDGWAYPLSPSWPRSYGMVRKTGEDTIEISLDKDGRASAYRLLRRVK